MRWLTKTSPGANSGMPGRRYPLPAQPLARRARLTGHAPLDPLALRAQPHHDGGARHARRRGFLDSDPDLRRRQAARRHAARRDRRRRDERAQHCSSEPGRRADAVDRPRGRPLHGAAEQIDQAGVRNWSVAAREGGGFIVAWQDTDGIHTATRTRAGRPTQRRLAVTSNGEEINGVLPSRLDPLGGWVLAERQFPQDEGPLLLRARDDAERGRTARRRDPGPRPRPVRARRAPHDVARRRRQRPRAAPRSCPRPRSR